jgi:hypothetical protein
MKPAMRLCFAKRNEIGALIPTQQIFNMQQTFKDKGVHWYNEIHLPDILA